MRSGTRIAPRAVDGRELRLAVRRGRHRGQEGLDVGTGRRQHAVGAGTPPNQTRLPGGDVLADVPLQESVTDANRRAVTPDSTLPARARNDVSSERPLTGLRVLLVQEAVLAELPRVIELLDLRSPWFFQKRPRYRSACSTSSR